MRIVYYPVRFHLHERTLSAKFQIGTQSPFAIAFPCVRRFDNNYPVHVLRVMYGA